MNNFGRYGLYRVCIGIFQIGGWRGNYGLFTINYLSVEHFSGGYGEGETPVPILNTEVKPLSVDGTSLVTGWESRSLPGINLSPIYRGQICLWWVVHGFWYFGARPFQDRVVVLI